MHHLNEALRHLGKALKHLYEYTDKQGSSVTISQCRNRINSAIQKTANHAKKQEQTRHVQREAGGQIEA